MFKHYVSVSISTSEHRYGTMQDAYLYMTSNGMEICCKAIPVAKARKIMILLGRKGVLPEMTVNMLNTHISTKTAKYFVWDRE